MSAESRPLHQELGLTDDESAEICDLLGRAPNPLELAMYAVMWSEHCSYKSSRRHLSRLPTEAPWVLVGPGENAGVIDVGDNIAIAIRIESHNHPSAVEPYQGAATGVGGILRDIFTMGARPIAVMDALRFGSFATARNRWLANGVVSGISGYGNSVGVPTVGGEFVACDTYSNNPLVNVAALGVLAADKIVLGQASNPGDVAILLGAPTGRDGIGGVSVLASAGFGDADEDAKKLPSVQVGDPFEEKRLIEACLEMLDAELLSGLQDLGGAGLTCATSETAARGGAGMEVDVSKVPRRQPNMQPFEVMTSESQERMLAIVSQDNAAQVLAICEKWEVSAAVIGRVTGDAMLRVIDTVGTGETGGGETSTEASTVLAEIPASTLTDAAPNYDRPQCPPADLAQRHTQDVLSDAALASSLAPDPTQTAPDSVNEDVLALLASAAYVYRQYDHQLFLNTVVGPGADATLLALRHPASNQHTGRGLGLSTDGNHRWCYTDPKQGTAAVVAEAVLNLACVGATPRALVNCLNFGNPEHPEVMWQLSQSIDGMAEACEVFETPVVGGNVSLYNEANEIDIAPTPVVCLLGIHPDLQVAPPGSALVNGHEIVLLGPPAAASVPMGGTLWAWDRQNHKGGALAEPDLAAIKRVGSLVAELVRESMVSGAHDVSAGGIALALTEMACMGSVGCEATAPLGSPDADSASTDSAAASADPTPQAAVRALFNESHGRVLVCVPPQAKDALLARAADMQTAAQVIGCAGGDRIQISPEVAGRQSDPKPDPKLNLPLSAALSAWHGNLSARLES